MRQPEIEYKDQSGPVDPDFLTQRVEGSYLRRIKESWQGRHLFHGKTPDEQAIQLTSNDYLSIANHPDIIEAQVSSLRQFGNGVAMSAVFHQADNPQADFEQHMAEFLQTEAVLTSQSGWCANTGLLQSIANQDIPVYLDVSAHMSMWEGARSAGAKAIPFVHNSASSLERMIKKYGKGVVCVDSVYSTNGDIAPLAELAEVTERYGCIFVVDESHSLGTHGPNGAGMVVAAELTEKVHFRTASLAKAFAGRGGIIAGNARNLEFFQYEARPAIFSSAVLPHDVAGFDATLRVIQKEQWRRVKLANNARFLKQGLMALGYNVSVSKSQILALEAGLEHQTMILRDALEANGVFGSVFCAPATPKHCSLIRFSVTAGHSQDQLAEVIDMCKKIRNEVDMINWPSTKRLKREPCLVD